MDYNLKSTEDNRLESIYDQPIATRAQATDSLLRELNFKEGQQTKNVLLKNNDLFTTNMSEEGTLVDFDDFPREGTYLETEEDVNNIDDIMNDNDDDGEFITTLSGNIIPKHQFTHNNEVPFHRGLPKQNVAVGSEENFDMRRVQDFTGRSPYETGAKKEQFSFFTPSKNVTFVHGTPSTSETMNSRVYVSNLQTNQRPFEQIREGPGLAIEDNQPNGPTGTFHQDIRQYIQPKNVDELRTEGRRRFEFSSRSAGNISGPSQRADPSKITKHKPTPGPLPDPVASRASVTKQADYGVTTEKKTERSKTGPTGSRSFGHASSVHGNESKWSSSVVNDVQKISLNPAEDGFRNAGNSQQSKTRFALNQQNMKNSIRDRELRGQGGDKFINDDTNRGVSVVQQLITNLGSYVKAIVAPITDILDTTKKDEMVDHARSQGGNLKSHVNKGIVFNPENTAKTTVRETTENLIHMGNVGSQSRYCVSIYDPENTARTTIRETTEDNLHEGFFGTRDSVGFKTWDPSHLANRTIRETTENNSHEGFFGNNDSQGWKVWDPSQIANTTIRETTEDNTHEGFLGNNDTQGWKVWDPSHLANRTIRETTENSDRVGKALQPRFKKDDKDRDSTPLTTTVKETTLAENVIGGASSGFTRAVKIQENVLPPVPTNRETYSDNDHYGGVSQEQSNRGGYQNVRPLDKPTQRESTEDYQQIGPAGSSATVNQVGATVETYNADISDDKEQTIISRNPTQSGSRQIAEKENIGTMDVSKELLEPATEDYRFIERSQNGTKVPINMGALTRIPEENEIDNAESVLESGLHIESNSGAERNSPSVFDKQLSENPYVVRL